MAKVTLGRSQCAVLGCEREMVAKGVCLKHYKRLRKWGSPTGCAPRSTPSEYVAARVVVGSAPGNRPGLGRCLVWVGGRNPAGYGLFRHWTTGRRSLLAHRAVLGLAGKEIPAGKVVDHLCRNRACVNLEHLEIVTNEENLRRGIGYRLRNGMDSACVHGHEYTPENTYRNPNNLMDIRCRECSRERDRARSRRKAA